jgi:hypothetical protein
VGVNVTIALLYTENEGLRRDSEALFVVDFSFTNKSQMRQAPNISHIRQNHHHSNNTPLALRVHQPHNPSAISRKKPKHTPTVHPTRTKRVKCPRAVTGTEVNTYVFHLFLVFSTVI